MIRRAVPVIAMLWVAAVVLIGCAGAPNDEQVADSAEDTPSQETQSSPGEDEADRQASGFPIAEAPQDPDETATGGAGTLPHTFPPAFPLPSDAEIRNSYGVGSGANVDLALEGTVEQAAMFFDSALAEAGWDVVDSSGREQPVRFHRLEAVGHEHEADVRIQQGDDQSVSIMVRLRAVD